jgi:hypothetical protein
MADNGWKIGNWEPPASKAPFVKAVSLNADWGTAPAAPVASVAPAGCSSSMVQHSHAAPAMRAGCSGRRLLTLGWRIRANSQARAQARFPARYMATGHS